MPFLSHTVEADIPAGIRLDRYIAEHLRLLPRSQIKTRALTADINGKRVKLSRAVKAGDCLSLDWKDAPPEYLAAEDIPLVVIYEDKRVIVIDKPQGMVVHPGAGNRSGTLANALYFRRLAKRGFSPQDGTAENCALLRPGIVHRLDKDTSGIIIAAWDDEALAFLAAQFKARQVKKTYAAIVLGRPQEKSGSIETFIARDRRDRKRFTAAPCGKHALTRYRVIKAWQNHSLLLLRPKTGRTHQLRVHLRYLGCPIAGDPIYGIHDPAFPKASLMLHAKKLHITLPGESDRHIFKAPLPDRFFVMMRELEYNRRGALQ
jgi:23S rRNA pseudouridine1911/1915/1917 synthase